MEEVSPATSIMGQYFKIVNRSRVAVAVHVTIVTLRILRRLFRRLLRTPLVYVALARLVLYLFTIWMDKLNEPLSPTYPKLPTVLESR